MDPFPRRVDPSSGRVDPSSRGVDPTFQRAEETSDNVLPSEMGLVCLYGASCEEIHNVRDDLMVGAILLYTRAREGKLVTSRKLIANDPATKPITIPAPCNRKEALASPWWQGYYEAELAEMQSHATNGSFQGAMYRGVPLSCETDGHTAISWHPTGMLSSDSKLG